MLNLLNQFWSLVFQRVTLLPVLSLRCHCLYSVQLDEWSSSDDLAKQSSPLSPGAASLWLRPRLWELFTSCGQKPLLRASHRDQLVITESTSYCWEHIFSQLIRRIVIKGFMRIDPRRSTHLCWSLLWQTWLVSTKVSCLPSQVPQSICCWEVRCLPHCSSKGLRMRAFNASSSPTTWSCTHHSQS